MLKSWLIPLKLYSSQLNVAFSWLNLGLLFYEGGTLLSYYRDFFSSSRVEYNWISLNLIKRHFLRKSGKVMKWPTQVLLIFIHITYVTDSSKTLKFFVPKLYSLGPTKFLPGLKKYSFFSQKWIFEGKFELRAG